MRGKQKNELFMEDVDKILEGSLSVSTNDWQAEDEEKQLLYLAQLLTKVDLGKNSELHMEDLWKKINKKGQLDDLDLDMVAGGKNEAAINNDKNKKDWEIKK